MILTLIRTKLDPGYTEGKLYVDGVYYCDTLERRYDPVLSAVAGSRCCIPFVNGSAVDGLGLGREGYPVVTAWSPHFRRLMPKICDVPGRDNILIHPGNNPEDSMGCILVGHKARDGFITHSRMAFEPLYARIAQAYKKGEEIRLIVRPMEAAMTQ